VIGKPANADFKTSQPQRRRARSDVFLGVRFQGLGALAEGCADEGISGAGFVSPAVGGFADGNGVGAYPERRMYPRHSRDLLFKNMLTAETQSAQRN
jgi:hypothetical protein